MGSIELLRILQAGFGIGLVIFVHELGHFIAARLCGVRVECFSIGFGPRILGWRWGSTTYQLAAIPMGGYCRMAGEERRYDGTAPRSDELPAKSVGQRFFIFSGGVLGNILFALVVFPILFAYGVAFEVPRIGRVAPGSPAWFAGIKPESDVVRVNGEDVFKFDQIQLEVALSGSDDVSLVVVDPDTGEEVEHSITPVMALSSPFQVIGVGPAFEHDEDGLPILAVREGSPAWDAGLRPGDRLVSVTNGIERIALEDNLNYLRGLFEPLALRVRNETGDHDVLVEPRSIGKTVKRVGISPPRNHVVAVRRTASALGLEAGDRLETIQGRRILRLGDVEAGLAVEGPLEIVVSRDGERVSLAGLPLDDEGRARLADDMAVAVDVEHTRILPQDDSPAALAGVLEGDVIRKINGVEVEDWKSVLDAIQAIAESGGTVELALERTSADGTKSYPTIPVVPADVEFVEYGVDFRAAEYVKKYDSILGAIGFGAYSSWKTMNELWLTVQRLLTAEFSPKNLGSIIMISQVSYELAAAGWTKFAFFLCLLSLNLAVVNLLPIPVLDGGHLFFLIVEKIKGSPVSERVLGYSQMVGAVLILSLLMYVVYNDVVRFLV